MKRRRRWPLLLVLPAVLPAALAVLDRCCPPDLSRFSVVGATVLDRHRQVLAELPANGGIWRLRTDAADVSPVFLSLLLHTEDRRFRAHGGIDLVSLARASIQWAVAGHVVSGGSTLAMQAARLLEPRPRTFRSKLIELFRATQLEERLGQDGVLSIWLTLAPYGGNLEGVEAGARAWFGIGANAIDRAQAAVLVALPRRPEALRPDRHPGRVRGLAVRLLGDGELEVPLPTARLPFPSHAMQAVRRLPRLPKIATTLDLPLQTGLEALLDRRLQDQPAGLAAAGLIADAGDGSLLAVATSGGSSLDLTRAVRSPGSALKPMLYGLAFQDGLAGPDSILSDLPRHFGRYAPENFDRRFTAPISAAEALRRSLNLPAVALLSRIGPSRFAAWLGNAGAPLALPPGASASLPLALGGGGVRMRDLAGLYAGLAGDGDARLLHLQPTAARVTRPMLQAAAAALVADVLTRDFPGGGPDGIAWKTGTSWGGRDAWAFGFDAAHVGAIWVGRPDGTAVAGITGVRNALPILSQVFSLLPPAPRPSLPTAQTATQAPTMVAAENPLRILFPPPDAELSMDGPVPIRVMGGRRPIGFLVDGAPLASHPVSRTIDWRPTEAGFYVISVIDADGSSDRVRIRVR